MSRTKRAILNLALILIVFTCAMHPQESKPAPTQQKPITSPQYENPKSVLEEKSINNDRDPNKYPPRIDYEELFAQSQRNFDRSVAVLNLAITLFCALLAIITILVAIAVAYGFFQKKKLKTAVNRAQSAADKIELLKKGTEKSSLEISELTRHIPLAELSSEYKEKLDNLSRRFEFLEALGMALSPTDYINRGNALFAKQQFRLAEEAYNKALELEPNNFYAMVNKASALSRQGNFEDSLALSTKAQEIRPFDLLNSNIMAVNLLKMGRPQESLEISTKILEKRSRESSALYNLACAYAQMEIKDKALEFLGKAISISGKYREEAKQDSDFQSLWEDLDFKRIVEPPEPKPASPIVK
jgi:tetratricopeptide (TPR) repeat protein